MTYEAPARKYKKWICTVQTVHCKKSSWVSRCQVVRAGVFPGCLVAYPFWATLLLSFWLRIFCLLSCQLELKKGDRQPDHIPVRRPPNQSYSVKWPPTQSYSVRCPPNHLLLWKFVVITTSHHRSVDRAQVGVWNGPLLCEFISRSRLVFFVFFPFFAGCLSRSGWRYPLL